MDRIEGKKFNDVMACNPTWQELVLLWFDIPSARATISDHLRERFRLNGLREDFFNRNGLYRFCRKFGRAKQAISEFRATQVAC